MNDLLYYIGKDVRDPKELTELIRSHPEIRFVSVVAVDLGNNHTDERIPIEDFLKDIPSFLATGVQTDGSSVNLPEIAEINNAKVDLLPDPDVKWLVDYNRSNLHDNGQPVGTLIIPAYLVHDGKRVGSRSIVSRAVNHFSDRCFELFESHPERLSDFGLSSIEEIDSFHLTVATELEFWVKTPNTHVTENTLSTSQSLKEQYWKRTVGQVRTAMESALEQLYKYGFEPEMGHKEVGGVASKLTASNQYAHENEQIEIDWKFDYALQSCDHELFAKDIIKDTFEAHGLEVTFQAKPIENVAGSGEHHHLGAQLRTTAGRLFNLFSPQDMTGDYLSPAGYGALMGILHNYEVINPFVTATNDAFNRLKPGFEAPVCTVCSLGHARDVASRNRTVLIGLVRDIDNPLATRFELRSPNPFTNSYLAVSALYQSMLDGMQAVFASGVAPEELEAGLNKKPGESHFYLSTDRSYRSEVDVFEDFTAEERDSLFGRPPKTVYENMIALDNNPEKIEMLLAGDVFTEAIISSYRKDRLSQWLLELEGRIIKQNRTLIRTLKRLHGKEDITDLDVVNWEQINGLRFSLMKDSMNNKSLFTKLISSIDAKEYETVSTLQVEMADHIARLKHLYDQYRDNLVTYEL